MRGSRKFCQRGSNSDGFFLVVEGRVDPKYHSKRAIISPPAKPHLMVFRWRGDDGPTLNTGLVILWFFRGFGPVLLETLYSCDFSGGSWPSFPPPPSGSAHVLDEECKMYYLNTKQCRPWSHLQGLIKSLYKKTVKQFQMIHFMTFSIIFDCQP